MNPAPASILNTLLMIVRHGTAIIAAMYFGASTNSTGSTAIVRSASISFVTTIVPISAENADPDRPLTTIAVISGPSFRVNPTAIMSMTNFSAPNRRNSAAVWIARINPAQAELILPFAVPHSSLLFLTLGPLSCQSSGHDLPTKDLETMGE
jgi:hypothetical protein